MESIDICIAVALALATIRLTFMGIQVNPKEKVGFYIIGVVILFLIAWQSYRNAISQWDMKTQLGIIEQNTNKSLADKGNRQIHREKLAEFLDTGEAIKQKCFSGLDVPRKEAMEWYEQIISYLKTMDSSHVSRFKNTRAPNRRLHYFLPDGTPVAGACNENAQDIDLKLDVLREFISELSA